MQLSAQGFAAIGSGRAPDSPGVFSIIADELAQVRAMIEWEISGCSELVRGLISYANAGKGKMIRPGLVLLSGLVCGGLTKKHIRAAAIIEMIHNATLLHDDVVDEGESRRGVPTLNRIRGNESAVLTGDFLLSRVFKMCVRLDKRTAEAIASASEKTCEGELRQTAQKGNWRLNESEYIEIIREKTSALFGVACEVGAILAGAEETQVEMLADYGCWAGIAFQITDDLLDLTGDRDKTGKEAGNDLERGKLTLPLIHLLGTGGEADRQIVMQVLVSPHKRGTVSGDEMRALVEKLRACGSIEYARRRAQEFSEQAVEAIGELRESDGKAALVELSRFIARRVA